MGRTDQGNSPVHHPPSLSTERTDDYSGKLQQDFSSASRIESHMICRSELKRLQGHQDYPSISVLAPTHRTAPANKRDRIVVKNLVAKGLKRLHDEFKKRDVASLVQNLNKLVDQVDWEHSLEGLALFASRDVATAIHSSFQGESTGRDRRHVRDA